MRSAVLVLALAGVCLAQAGTKARKLVDQGKFDEAVKVAQKAVEKDAKDIEAWLALADAWVGKNDPHEAWTMLEGALEGNQGVAALHVKLGDVFIKVAEKIAAEQGDGTSIRSHYMDADRSYEAALKIDPKSAAAMFGRAFSNYQLSGDSAERKHNAQQFTGQALMLDPKLAKAHALQAYMFYGEGNAARRARKERDALAKYKHALAKYETALGLDKSVVINFIRYGRCHQALGQMGKAKDAYMDALVNHPDSLLPITSGLAYCFNKDWRKGVDVMKEATEKAPTSKEVWFYYGYTLFTNNRFDDALVPLKKAAGMSGSARDMYYVGHCYESGGKTKQAIDAYRKSLKIAPDYAQPTGRWMMLLLRSGDVDAAEKQFDELLTLAPNDGWLRNNYALMLRDWAERRGAKQKSPDLNVARRIQKAGTIYEQAAAILTDVAQVQSDTGLLFEFYPVNFDKKKALKYFSRSLELSEYTYRDAFDGLNRLCSKVGDWETLADYAEGVIGALERGKNPIAPVGGGQPRELPNEKAGLMARARAALARAQGNLKKAG
ncbi:MAG: tetratricopeptide repeat protein [Planctomycetota bacterium]|nr:tetratricopeptide repeat protein [Planctomycetota bacterium]